MVESNKSKVSRRVANLKLVWMADPTLKQGFVDGLFGRVRAWIRDYLITTKKRIIAVDDLMAVVRRGAQTANERDQGGARHIVERFEPEAKPAAVWRVENPFFQMKKDVLSYNYIAFQ